MKITKSQSNKFRSISISKQVAKNVLEIAENFYEKSITKVLTQEQRLWEDIAKDHNLDLSKVAYKADFVDGEFVISENKDHKPN